MLHALKFARPCHGGLLWKNLVLVGGREGVGREGKAEWGREGKEGWGEGGGGRGGGGERWGKEEWEGQRKGCKSFSFPITGRSIVNTIGG